MIEETDYAPITAIVFDLDGVLVDSRQLHYEALNCALAEEGARYVIGVEEHLAKYDGCTTKTKLQRLTAEKGLPIERHGHVWLSKQAHTLMLMSRLIEPSPALQQTLAALRADGYRLFCASNSTRSTLEGMLDALHLRPFFEAIYSNDDAAHYKPHPNIYLRCYVDNGLVPQQCVVVEDSPIGRTAATLSGAHVCAVASTEQVTYAKIAHAVRAAEAANRERKIDTRWLSDVQIVVPMAGLGSRFAAVGYDRPKPLIDVLGRPMIEWVVENMNVAGARFVFIVRTEHLEDPRWNLRAALTAAAPGCAIVATDGLTEGPACSVLLAEGSVDPNKPLLIANSDQFLEWDAGAFMYQSQGVDGSISVFDQPDPTDKKWSYVALDADGAVRETREKEPISELASTGIYYWKRAGDFFKFAREMIAAQDRVNNEFYVCPVYNYAVRAGCRVKAIRCKRMWGLGVPADLDAFLDAHANRAKSRPQ